MENKYEALYGITSLAIGNEEHLVKIDETSFGLAYEHEDKPRIIVFPYKNIIEVLNPESHKPAENLASKFNAVIAPEEFKLISDYGEEAIQCFLQTILKD
ncbi:MAG: hypothetical protein WC781_01940 [Candidatus Pacearchaeota archaeon]|jgi:hypothetical protein